MDVAQWLTETNPDELINYISDGFSRRKALLLAVACRRRLVMCERFATESSKSSIAADVAELWADGLVGEPESRIAYDSVYGLREAPGRMILSDPDSEEPNEGTAMYYAIEAAVTLLQSNHSTRHVVAVTLWQCREAIRFGDRSPDREMLRADSQSQCDIIRDNFGNPFRLVTLDPSWRTSTAVAIARGMYDFRDFSAMPILADALQDAGCENDDILNHCRGPGPHVRGCWVVDRVLGKE